MTTKIAAGRSELTFRAAVSRTPLLPASPVASNKVGNAARHMPLFIPADQAFYWSLRWQEDVQESMRALRDGDYEDFDSNDPNDVAHWLLSVDENDC